jgi:hypothetical protein
MQKNRNIFNFLFFQFLIRYQYQTKPMKIYIKANSKAEINRGLAEGKDYVGTNHSFFGGGGQYNLRSCEVGAVVAVFSQYSGGQPVAKSWGTWDGTKLK